MSCKLYYAKTGVIRTYDSVDFEIKLGFGVKITKCIRLQLGIPKVKEFLKAKAKRCIVILFGGKKVLLEVTADEQAAAVYAMRKCGSSEYVVDIDVESAVDVTQVMRELYKHDFSPDYLVNNILKIDNSE